MIHYYYVVYSALTDKGSAVGRTVASRSGPIETMADVEAVERAVLESARAKEPTMRSLFLTYWTELRDAS